MRTARSLSLLVVVRVATRRPAAAAARAGHL